MPSRQSIPKLYINYEYQSEVELDGCMVWVYAAIHTQHVVAHYTDEQSVVNHIGGDEQCEESVRKSDMLYHI